MSRVLAILTVILMHFSCKGQNVQVKELFRLGINRKDCKAVAPEVFQDSKFFYYYGGSLYLVPQPNWCAIQQNKKTIPLPQQEDIGYKILPDNNAVISFVENYQTLFYFDFKSGALTKIDTIIRNSNFSKRSGDSKFRLKRFEFTGGVFSETKYFLSAIDKIDNTRILLIKDFETGSLDSLSSTFGFENYVARVISNDRFIVSGESDVDVFAVEKKTHIKISNSKTVIGTNRVKVLKSDLDKDYLLLQFVNDSVVLFHHIKNPEQFALLNVTNGRSTKISLDSRIFGLQNLRREEITEAEDGPSDGLQRQKFIYLSCRMSNNSVLLSFASQKNERLAYSLSFSSEMLNSIK